MLIYKTTFPGIDVKSIKIDNRLYNIFYAVNNVVIISSSLILNVFKSIKCIM